jgi:hypothetical protein
MGILGRFNQILLITANLTRIYVALSFGPEKSPTIKSLIIQQLPRPRTVRLLWDISQKLSGSAAEKVAPSHVCRIAVTGLELACASFSKCQRRGCEKTSTARCALCKSGYCALRCQKRYVRRDLIKQYISDRLPATGRTTNWFVG